MIGIYILTSKTTGKSYVGQSKNIKSRLRRQKYLQGPTMIRTAIKELGWSDFEITYFEYPIDDLDKQEREMIVKMNSITPNGYNSQSGGRKEFILSDHQKGLLAEAAARITPETREKLRQASLNISDEHREKLRQASLNMSDIVKAKIGQGVRAAWAKKKGLE